MLSADSVCGVMLLEAELTSDPFLDPATVLFKPNIQVDARPVMNVATKRRADCARVGAMPVGVTRSGTKPTTDRAERKNLWPLSLSRVALSIVSIRRPSRSIGRNKQHRAPRDRKQPQASRGRTPIDGRNAARAPLSACGRLI